MRLKYLFHILAFLQIIVLAMAFMAAFDSKKTFFFLMEGVIIIILLFLIYFHSKVVKPINSISSGMDLLKGQDFSTRLTPVGQFESDRIILVFNKMMEQLKYEKLRKIEQNHFLELLISASPMGVIIFDFDGHISMTNKAATKILDVGGAESLIGKKMGEVDSALAHKIAQIKMDSVETIRMNDSKIYRCSHLSFIDRGFAHPFLLLESLTDEVMKAEKKAYEKVIRLISHEVNNTVAGVTSAINSATSIMQQDSKHGDLIDLLEVCIGRCINMSNFITNFADVVKIPEPILVQTNINDCIRGCKSFIETMCASRNITLTLNLCSDESPMILADILLLEQALVNIIKNSVESIDGQPINKARDIFITTSSQPMMLEVADNGKGITQEVEQKLFTPFFSTKSNGQGIGLIFIREVLQKHHCSFSLRTYPDGITRFKIFF